LEDLGCARLAGGDRGGAVEAFDRVLRIYVDVGAARDAARARKRLRELGIQRRVQSLDRPKSERYVVLSLSCGARLRPGIRSATALYDACCAAGVAIPPAGKDPRNFGLGRFMKRPRAFALSKPWHPVQAAAQQQRTKRLGPPR